MTEYEKAVRQFRVRYLLRLVIKTQGNVLEASRVSGIHRNTFSRMLREGGYELTTLRRQIRRGQYIPGGDD